ncbi:hypothetical protein HY988_04520 [Candidatus Micrarchaeota archaeon]|nr:hypothetical protein [Candidatus Micrarchaeota archaeon]
MKTLTFHVKSLLIEAGVSGKTPSYRRRAEEKLKSRLGLSLPELHQDNRSISSPNAILTWVCVEQGDERISLDQVAKDIMRIQEMIRSTDIVIGAFGHLSDKVALPHVARIISDQLFHIVQSRYERTMQIPFGWDKSISSTIPMHNFNAGFRSYAPETEIISLVKSQNV